MKGFTIIELFIVMTIIGIMAAITVPACMDLKADAQRQEYNQTINLD